MFHQENRPNSKSKKPIKTKISGSPIPITPLSLRISRLQAEDSERTQDFHALNTKFQIFETPKGEYGQLKNREPTTVAVAVKTTVAVPFLTASSWIAVRENPKLSVHSHLDDCGKRKPSTINADKERSVADGRYANLKSRLKGFLRKWSSVARFLNLYRLIRSE